MLSGAVNPAHLCGVCVQSWSGGPGGRAFALRYAHSEERGCPRAVPPVPPPLPPASPPPLLLSQQLLQCSVGVV